MVPVEYLRLWLFLACLGLLGIIEGCDRSARDAPYLGYAEGEYVQVAAPVAGRLIGLDVQRGDQVAAGQLVFTLEHESELAAKGEAEARRRQAQSRLEDIGKGRRPEEIRVVREQVAQAQSALRLSAAQLTRQRALVARGFVSSAGLDAANAAYQSDAARVKELEAQLATTHLPARSDELAAARAEVEAAGKVVAQNEWRLDQKTQAAPVAGRVDNTFYRLGEYVAAGSPVLAILPPSALKLRFYVPETSLANIAVGQTVSVHCDGCNRDGNGDTDRDIAARISFIAAEAEYTPPVIYSKENRAKLVFLVEARPAAEDAVRLHPGLPVEVRATQAAPSR